MDFADWKPGMTATNYRSLTRPGRFPNVGIVAGAAFCASNFPALGFFQAETLGVSTEFLCSMTHNAKGFSSVLPAADPSGESRQKHKIGDDYHLRRPWDLGVRFTPGRRIMGSLPLCVRHVRISYARDGRVFSTEFV